MKTESLNVQNYLAQAEFIVPAYQRPYQWTDDLLEGLWSDLGEMYVGTNKKNHYIGVLLSVDEASPASAIRGPASKKYGRTVWSLVDGQQRLVTLLLLLAALRDTGPASVAREMKSLLAVTGGPRPRLQGQEEDRPLLKRILLTAAPELTAEEAKTRVGNTYTFFTRQLAGGTKTFWKPLTVKAAGLPGATSGLINVARLALIVKERVVLTDMMLEDSDQPAPAVFDAINGKRRELEPVDLLRNTVFAELNDINLFTKTWARIEAESRKVKVGSARLGTLPLFIDSYLHSLGEGASQYRLARRLNELILAEAPMNLGAKKRRDQVERVVHELVASFDDFKVAQSSAFGGYAASYKPAAVRALDNISMLSSGPPLPLSLLFLRYRRERFINDSQLARLTLLLESYLGRRVVAGSPQQLLRSHLGSVTSKLIRDFGNGSDVGRKRGNGLKATTLTSKLVQYLNTPTMMAPKDTALGIAVESRIEMNKLSARQRFAVLRRANDEIAGRHISHISLASRTSTGTDYSIEHVFPDSFGDRTKITSKWEKQLSDWGENAAQVRDLISLRNNLGNYTLVHHNSALGRRPFLDAGATQGKRSFLKDRPVYVSHSVVNRTTSAGSEVERLHWTASDVLARANYLAGVLKTAYPLS